MKQPPRRARTFIAVIVAGLIVVSLAVFGIHHSNSQAHSKNSLAALTLANVPGQAAVVEAAYKAAGDTTDANYIGFLAKQPTATWLTGGSGSTATGNVEATVAKVITQSKGATPVLVVYNIVQRDCGGFSNGGVMDAEQYSSYISNVASGVGQASVVYILEPDAIAQTLPNGGCTSLSGAEASDRYILLTKAVSILAADKNAHIYLDAGNAGWGQNRVGDFATALKASGIAGASGFSVNVSNFYTNAQSIAYAQKLSAQLGGAHFVIDTSRNGSGVYAGTKTDPNTAANPAYCNPPGRTVGTFPTTHTNVTGLDAYLWIKIPGASDGTCRMGPAAGSWDYPYALDLVKQSLAAEGK